MSFVALCIRNVYLFHSRNIAQFLPITHSLVPPFFAWSKEWEKIIDDSFKCISCFPSRQLGLTSIGVVFVVVYKSFVSLSLSVKALLLSGGTLSYVLREHEVLFA